MTRDEPSDLQREILETADRNPDASAAEIAAICDCSVDWVEQTLDIYGDPADDPNPFGGWL